MAARKLDPITAAYAAATEMQQQDPEQMVRLTKLAKEVVDTTFAIDDLETELETRKRTLARLTEEDCPAVMALLGLDEFSIPGNSGGKLIAKEEVFASFPNSAEFPQRAEEGREYLVKSGNASIVKAAVTIEFDVSDKEAIERVTRQLHQENPHRIVTFKLSVHAGSLKRVIRELREQGHIVPLDILGAHIKNLVKLKLPKEKE